MSTWEDTRAAVAWAYDRMTSWLHGQGDAIMSMISRDTFTQPWPPISERPRLSRYLRYRLIYESAHETVYIDGLDDGHKRYRYDDDRPYLIDNLCGEITDLLVSRLFGEELHITGPANDEDAAAWLDHLAEISDLSALWPRLARGISYRGDGWLKPIYDAEAEDVLLTTVPPTYTFVETRSDDDGAIERVMIAYIRWAEQRPYLYQEIHSRGLIEHKLYKLHGDLQRDYGYTPSRDQVELATVPDLANLPDEQETGVDEILMVHIGTTGSDESGIWGTSDYRDIDSLQGELNNRHTQRGEILDKHADPPVTGSADMLNEDGEVDIAGKFFPMLPGEAPPAYVTWDGHLGPSENEITDLRLAMMRNAGISPESLMDSEGGAESGRALKLRQARTSSAVKERQREYGPKIARAISLASKLANSEMVGPVWDGAAIPILEPTDLNLAWGDGLPNDTMQEIEETGMEISFGIMSRQTAIEQRHPDWNDERVQEELDRIAADRGGGVPGLGEIGRLGLGLGDELEDVEETE